jgi:hypothetical protein
VVRCRGDQRWHCRSSGAPQAREEGGSAAEEGGGAAEEAAR